MAIADSTVNCRDIDGFRGYRIGDDGSVWSCHPRNRMGTFPASWRQVKVRTGKHGYVQVVLRHPDGKARTRLVHRLVLEAFVGPCQPGSQCRHLNGQRTDNSLANLLWGTPQENAADRLSHGTARIGEASNLAKLTEDQVRPIRHRFATRQATQVQLAAENHITQANVSEIVRRRTWKHVP